MASAPSPLAGPRSVLLKDYPETQRRQILDLLFKPNFGASISVLFVEVGGDGNSTQGVELSHMHTRNDQNYSRGYEWWLMREAKQRNPGLALDACAWSAPAWVGHGQFFSQDMCDYYANWIIGLKEHYGLRLDAVGCRNERGVNVDFAKMFRRTLDARGLKQVRLHAFDNWDRHKWDWCDKLETDAELRDSIDILSNHTLSCVYENNGPTPDSVKALAERFHKPIWDTEEHVVPRRLPVRADAGEVPQRELHRCRRGADRRLVPRRFDVPRRTVQDQPRHADGGFALERTLRRARGAVGLRALRPVQQDRLAVPSQGMRTTGRRRHVRDAQVAGDRL